MVKGITRQVIVVHAPEPKLFEQAIFILNENASQAGITDEALLKEAEDAIRAEAKPKRRRSLWSFGAFWAALGALFTGFVWIATVLF